MLRGYNFALWSRVELPLTLNLHRETGTLANIAEGKGVFGNPFGLVERHNMLVRAYKGIQILDRETTVSRPL